MRPTGAGFRVANDPAGLAALVDRLRPLAPALIALEATGGYELPAVAACQAAGIPVAAVNPRQARDFAKGVGKLAKTDAIDAAVLAHFAEAVRPEPRPAEPAERLALDALLTRRGQVIAMRVMESNRLETCADPAVRAAIGRHVARLEAEEAEADRLPGGGGAGPARRGSRATGCSGASRGSGRWSAGSSLAALPGLGARRRPPASRPWAGLAPVRPRQRAPRGAGRALESAAAGRGSGG